MKIPSETFTFLAAELIFLVVRSNDIKVIFKKKEHLSKQEIQKIKRGLRRSILLELILFVPVSAFLIILLEPILSIYQEKQQDLSKIRAYYSLLGIISYGFPFASLRRVVTQFTLATIKEYTDITIKEKQDEI